MNIEEKKLAKILNNIAILLQIKGENPFKARAYANAAEKIRSNEVDIYSAYKNNTIHTLQGFGDALVKKINEFFETGKISFYEKLIEEIPESVADLIKVKNIGVAKAKKLFYELNITNLEQLVEAGYNNKLIEIKGISKEIQEQILISAQHKIASKGRLRQEEGYIIANNIIKEMLSIQGVVSATLTSDCRRFTETIKEFVFCVLLKDGVNIESIQQQINILFENYKSKYEHIFNLKYIITNDENYACILHSSTGNQEYLKSFYSFAESQGYNIFDDTIYKNNEKISIKSENDIYSLLNLQYVPPELRESSSAIQKAKEYQIPKLIQYEDIQGLIHVHSNWSDGKNSIEEMALKALELGFSYIAICDHSRSAAYTGGLSIERVKEQHYEIEKLNQSIQGITILKGIESDILPDGSLDYPEDVLKGFDLVVASVHSSFSMNKIDMTNRIIKAIKNPSTHILGHPTGRLILNRLPYEVEILDIIKAAADYGKIIEINANPYRLDLPWEFVIIAKDYGVRFSINPDSHNINTFTDVRYGVYVARKGWLEAEDVINSKDVNKFLKYFV